MATTIHTQPGLIEVVDRPTKADRRSTVLNAVVSAAGACFFLMVVQDGGDLFSGAPGHLGLPRIAITVLFGLTIVTSIFSLCSHLLGIRRDIRIGRFRSGQFEQISETVRGAQTVHPEEVREIRAVTNKVDWPAWYRIEVYTKAGGAFEFPWQRDRAGRDALIAQLREMFPEADVTSNAK